MTPGTTRLDGRLTSIQPARLGPAAALEAELRDGDGRTILLVWMGRERIAGIEPGAALTVEGRVGTRNGRATMFNPRYELIPGR